MRTKFLSLAMGLLVGLLALPASAVILSFNPGSPYTVNSGDTLSVDVMISSLGSQIVSAYDLDVGFDATLLNVTGVSFGPWLGDPLLVEVFEDAFWDNSGGLVDFAAVSLLSDSDLATLQGPAGGSFGLATLSFTAISAGTASLDFQWGAGNDVKGARSQQIYPAPEPATVMLVGAGMLVLLGIRRSRNAATVQPASL